MLLINRLCQFLSAFANVDEADEDSSALESHVVMAGSSVGAALEILGVRPRAEIAAVVPGAGEVQDLSELLLASDFSQDASDDKENEEVAEDAARQDEGNAEEGDGAHGLEGDKEEEQGLGQEANGSARVKVPPKQYPIVDDLWGESLLQTGASVADFGDVDGVEIPFPDSLSSEEEKSEQTQQESSFASGGFNSSQLSQLLRRRWTPWGTCCPVSLKDEELVVEGQKQHAVEFAGKMFLLADEEKEAKFLRDPKRYLDVPPALPPTTSVFLFGPSYAGASKQARLLERTYGFSVIDAEKEIAQGLRRLEEERQRRREQEERRIAELALQQKLRREREQEVRERAFMAAEDDAERLALAFPKSNKENFPQVSGEETEEIQDVGKGGPEFDSLLPLAPGSLSFELFPPENPAAPEDVQEESPKVEPFMVTEAEEKMLMEGKALGKQTCLYS